MQRIDGLVLPGMIKQVDYKAAYARVAMVDDKGNGILTDWLRWAETTAGTDREWSPPAVGEMVLVISPTGNLNNGIIFTSFNYTEAPPICEDPEINRKTWGKPKDKSFFDYPFWEVRKTKGRAHEWNYLPEGGEFKHQISDKVLVHFTEQMLLFRIGNTQFVLKDGTACLSITNNLGEPEEITEFRMTQKKLEMHADHQASLVVSKMDPSDTEVRANVEIQVAKQSVIYIDADTIGLNVRNDAVLSLKKDDVTLEARNAKAQLSLKQGMSKLCLDGVACSLSPALAKLGMNGSNVDVAASLITLGASSALVPLNTGYGATGSMGAPYAVGPVPPVPHPTLLVIPQALKAAWKIEESKKGPYYPRTQKPKE